MEEALVKVVLNGENVSQSFLDVMMKTLETGITFQILHYSILKNNSESNDEIGYILLYVPYKATPIQKVRDIVESNVGQTMIFLVGH